MTRPSEETLRQELDELGQNGLYRPMRVIESPQGSEVVIGGKRLINLSSNNYLGLNTHPRLVEATVDATLNTVARGKKTKVVLQYKMLWKDHWVVYDVVTDEQSMLENYRAEFNKIINRDGFDALLKKMRKKLDEKDDDSE